MNKRQNLDETLDDDIWKDSFDRLLNKRSLLREQKIIKNKVRVSFNNDSSVEASKSNVSKQFDLEENKNQSNGRRKPAGSISTPISIQKLSGPFDCTLSPISTWRLTHIPEQTGWESSCPEKSQPSEKGPRLSSGCTNSCENTHSSEPAAASFSIPNSIPRIEVIDDSDSAPKSPEENSLRLKERTSEHAISSVLLPPGKWRRSLIVWRKLHHVKHEGLDHNSRDDRFNRYSRTTEKSFARRRTTLQICPSQKSQLELLKVCKQTKILPFSNTYSDSALRKCRKIGEGTYGEVFLNSTGNDETVIKIIPIEGDIDVNGEPQKSFEQILPEVIITAELSNLRKTETFRTSAFVFLKNVQCVRGKYPDHLIELWDLYERNYGSENDHPHIFKDDQLYVALEIAYGGKDLEGFTFRNSEQAHAIFLQVALSLAAAERRLEFEHRDLHCGNILIKPTNDKNVEYTINSNKIQIPTCGVKATIIDYTLSRITLNKCCYYNDLSEDEELFCAKGDYQYDIYRLMRTKLRNDWKTHDAQTNVMWLHYLLTKLIDDGKYKNYRSRQHLFCMGKMKEHRETMLNYSSAFEFVNKVFPSKA